MICSAGNCSQLFMFNLVEIYILSAQQLYTGSAGGDTSDLNGLSVKVIFKNSINVY